jgi:hypothetical protein
MHAGEWQHSLPEPQCFTPLNLDRKPPQFVEEFSDPLLRNASMAVRHSEGVSHLERHSAGTTA